MERFELFRFSVLAAPLGKGFSVHLSTVYGDGTGSGAGFGSWKTVLTVPALVSGENGSDGSSSRFPFGSCAILAYD